MIVHQIVTRCGQIILFVSRFNLDPFNQYTEEQIWNALERSHMKECVSTFTLVLTCEPDSAESLMSPESRSEQTYRLCYVQLVELTCLVSGVPAAAEVGGGGGGERRKLLSGRETDAVCRQSSAETVQGERQTGSCHLIGWFWSQPCRLIGWFWP